MGTDEANPSFMAQLEVWEQVEYNIWEDEGKTVPEREYQSYLRARAVELEAKGLTGNETYRPLVVEGKMVTYVPDEEECLLSEA